MSTLFKKEVLDFGHCKVHLTMSSKLIYLLIDGEWRDEDAIATTERLEFYFDAMGIPMIRVWDASRLDQSNFKLTPQGARLLGQWAEKIKKKCPGHIGYFVGKDPLVYGLTRMYELRTSDEKMPIHVFSSFHELPEEVKQELAELEKEHSPKHRHP